MLPKEIVYSWPAFRAISGTRRRDRAPIGETAFEGGEGMRDLKLMLDDLSFIGSRLERPKSVLPMANGDVYSSDSRGDISRISVDGTTTLIGALKKKEAGFVTNGFTMLKDGSLLVCNIGAHGRVWKLARGGQLTPWLIEVDGVHFGMPNFVLLDHEARVSFSYHVEL